jgi:2-polyprenyl-6-hydroxyphenyl methylase/3-demethylubiquinone-9 3-methyltransferase
MIESRSAYRHNAAPSCIAAFVYPAILDVLRRHGCRRVLDIGCGNGTLCRVLSDAGHSVVGIEPSASGVEAARAAAPGGTFCEMGVYDDPSQLPEADFDAAVSTDVVEHLFAPAALPQFAAAKLKPGGLLVLSTPYHGYLKNLVLSLCNAWDRHHTPLWDGGHIKFWSRPTLTALLEANGFQVIEFHGVGRLPFVWKGMVLAARRVAG